MENNRENKQFLLVVETEQATDLAIDLALLDDIEVEIEEKNLSPVDSTKEHPSYSLDSATLTTLVVSISGLITSFAGLAKAIFDARATMKTKKSESNEHQKEPAIIINNLTINLSKFPTPEELASYLKKELNA